MNSRKIIAMVVAAAMSAYTVSVPPVSSNSDIEILTSSADDLGKCGENATWTFNNGTLTISGTGKMDDYHYVTDIPWHLNYQGKIKSVVIENGITSIGSLAFLSCYRLESVTIPNSVTYIGERAFNDCNRLKSITIPNSVTEIGKSAFVKCSSLESINIPDSVTIIGNEAFLMTKWLEKKRAESPFVVVNGILIDCATNEENVIIPDNVVYIGNYVFSNNTSLKSVTIPNSVTSIYQGAFSGCSSLRAC